MDHNALKSSLLGYVNDHTHVVDSPSGIVVYLPLWYGDEDTVALTIEPVQDDLIRISDQGATALRLRLEDVKLDSPSVREAWNALTNNIRQTDSTVGADDLSTLVHPSDLGEGLVDVALACVRAEHVRLKESPPAKVRFSDRVVRRLDEAVLPWVTQGGVFNRYPAVTLSSGRKRHITASFSNSQHDKHPLFIQSVSGNSREAKEEQISKGFHLFSFLQVDQDQKITVASGTRDSWDPGMVREIGQVSDVIFFDEPRELESVLQHHWNLAHR